jgi:hypothetical protein
MIAFELRDLAAAADLIEALRGHAPETDRDARRRERLADLLDDALFAELLGGRREATT